MEGPVVQSRDLEILGEVDAFVAAVGVGAIALRRGQPALVTEADHVLRVQRFDVSADVLGPVVDDGGVAAAAARLVGELPGEDGAGRFVPIDDELDVFFVGFLGCGVGIETIVISAERACVGVEAAQVVVVIV